MSETLQVQKREATGSLAMRKLRQQGMIPAILYGHGEDNICLSLTSDAAGALIQHGSKLVNLAGGVNETAILRDVQWDSLGSRVIHLDFARVSQTEKVAITLPVELHGEAPGVSNGGILEFLVHEIEIECAANKIPEHIVAEISGLNVGDAVHASELSLPDGASLVGAPENVIVQVVEPKGSRGSGGDVAGEDAATEPEVIAKGGEKTEEDDA